jgi:hypothetical protein
MRGENPVSEFFVGRHRVVPTDNGGFWIYPNGGARARYYGPESHIAQSLGAGNQEVDPEVRARNFAAGTHEPVYYLRNERGEAGIPPEPGLPIPAGSTLHEAKSLAEIDALSREMSRDLLEKVFDDGTATRFFDRLLGNPIETLKDQMRNPRISRMERDVIPLLIQDLERMEDRNRDVEANVRFRSRES